MQGKVVICTGGASGMGRATAELLASRGAKLVLSDINEAQGLEAVEAIRVAGGEASFVRTDVSSEDDVRRMVQHAVDTYGRLDGAFNNAGIGPGSCHLHEMDLAVWQRTIAINLTGVFLCLKHEIAAMLQTGGGSIVNTSSAAGLRGNVMFAEYVSSKHGLIGLTRAAALEYGPHNIRVNALAPGSIRTPMLQQALDMSLLSITPARYPLGRIGETAEVAEAAAWLLSDAASYVSGAVLPVDGGSTAT